ncbi:UNKNOWN [Stylonychia lemnae]|uniref:Uncharacterized protein n=1 Tax=Stylonychia lemnae TaxID=5949 RepID=A0A078ANX4_STYLE|nr:UNKNOWN [Stylonychia lemnae]|eukprot:CDW83631.1 UNKNOWN [Stylonychia lemnae]
MQNTLQQGKHYAQTGIFHSLDRSNGYINDQKTQENPNLIKVTHIYADGVYFEHERGASGEDTLKSINLKVQNRPDKVYIENGGNTIVVVHPTIEMIIGNCPPS